MRFQVNRDVFSETVSFVVKLLAQRPTAAELAGVLLEASGDQLVLSTFDYEVSSKASIAAAVETAGTVLVHGRLLADIAGRLPNAPVTVWTEDNRVLVTCGSAKFTLASMPVEKYPPIPEVSGPSGLVPADVFAEAVGQVAVAASRDDVTPVITGVQLAVSNNELSLVATDRFRVAIRDVAFDGATSDLDALVPARTILEVSKTFSHAGTISVTLSDQPERKIIAFSADQKTVTSQLIRGNYPPVRKLFPDTVDHYAVLSTSELSEAIRRVALVLERDAALRFSFNQDGLTLEALGSESAQASEVIDLVLHGEDKVVSLRPQFVLDALGSVHSEFVRISFTASESSTKPGPVLITAQTSRDGESNKSYRYLLQPNLLSR